MAINLDEHKIFDWQLKIETVPLSIAKRAVEEALENFNETDTKFDEAMELIKKSVNEMNSSINNALQDD